MRECGTDKTFAKSFNRRGREDGAMSRAGREVMETNELRAMVSAAREEGTPQNSEKG